MKRKKKLRAIVIRYIFHYVFFFAILVDDGRRHSFIRISQRCFICRIMYIHGSGWLKVEFLFNLHRPFASATVVATVTHSCVAPCAFLAKEWTENVCNF